ncbi:50S ribosomal protein L19, partial [Escherichia coli]|nr:50S ribosomal protein L19 [Escherichia coli]
MRFSLYPQRKLRPLLTPHILEIPTMSG